MIQTVATHIELRPNRDGHPRAYIAGTRVRVQDIYAQAEIHGRMPEDIVEGLPHLTLATCMPLFFIFTIIVRRFCAKCMRQGVCKRVARQGGPKFDRIVV
jgi:uncharacterized protein (DUF433 family)